VLRSVVFANAREVPHFSMSPRVDLQIRLAPLTVAWLLVGLRMEGAYCCSDEAFAYKRRSSNVDVVSEGNSTPPLISSALLRVIQHLDFWTGVSVLRK
jgi:hypothetical protein